MLEISECDHFVFPKATRGSTNISAATLRSLTSGVCTHFWFIGTFIVNTDISRCGLLQFNEL